MTKRIRPAAIRVHDDPDLFREAVNFTASETGFAERLIEKDYFCTLLIAGLASCEDLVFKGGTCLTKVHVGFYRLSEDLDFVISTPVDEIRASRTKRIAPVREAILTAVDESGCFRVSEPLKGANKSSQYVGAVVYRSLVTGEDETVKLEFSLREPLLIPAVLAEAGTILLDPISGDPIVRPLSIQCISAKESIAEKYRAALSRRDVAIRDYYDIQYAMGKLGIDFQDPLFIDLVRKKLAVPGNHVVAVSPARLAQLRAQLDARLRPVLRPGDFDGFELEHAIKLVLTMAEAVMGIP